MVNLMLNDLCRPASESSDSSLELGDLPLHFDGLIAFAFVGDAQQRKTSFFDIIQL